jgi:hypothetical protein
VRNSPCHLVPVQDDTEQLHAVGMALQWPGCILMQQAELRSPPPHASRANQLSEAVPQLLSFICFEEKGSWYAANAKTKEGSCYVLVPVFVAEVIQNHHLTIDFGALFCEKVLLSG